MHAEYSGERHAAVTLPVCGYLIKLLQQQYWTSHTSITLISSHAQPTMGLHLMEHSDRCAASNETVMRVLWPPSNPHSGVEIQPNTTVQTFSPLAM